MYPSIRKRMPFLLLAISIAAVLLFGLIDISRGWAQEAPATHSHSVQNPTTLSNLFFTRGIT